MTATSLHETALLLVDNQQGLSHPTFYGTSRSTPAYEQNLPALLAAFRAAVAANPENNQPLIVHVYHISRNPLSPLHSSSPGVDFLDIARPVDGEPVISKTVNSSFIGTDLEALLRRRGIRRLYVAGLTIDHCVGMTVRMAANLGVTDHKDESTGKVEAGEVVLVEDASAAFAKGGFDAETVHRVHVESLRGEFCQVVTTAEAVGQVKGV